ncbi:MAG TPA: hypothetical protein VN803_02570, partial [Gemmatimonadales bacterium]|nr:hypothetical protein [Gemmatimonadales bacterium]
MAQGIGVPVHKRDGGRALIVDRANSGIVAGGAVLQHIRKRCTVAEINAGVELLAAPGAGFAYRIVDASMIAIGGAASGATTVDILATLATASRKLVAAAIAGLTQSAVLRAGAANATVLADGASFTVNDANTAITVAKTGSALATATHVDVSVSYVIDEV